MEIDIKQLQRVRSGSDCRRCAGNGSISVHAAVIASDLPVEIKEGHVVGGDRKANLLC